MWRFNLQVLFIVFIFYLLIIGFLFYFFKFSNIVVLAWRGVVRSEGSDDEVMETDDDEEDLEDDDDDDNDDYICNRVIRLLQG